MKRRIHAAGQRTRANWKSGLTVALVSLPLSISLAVASGATPTMGIITAIWAGLFSSMFGGSHYNVVGPTGALSGTIALYAAAQGTAALPMLAIVTGLIILAAWVFRLDRLVRKIPSHTVHGFTIGVAVTIAATQLGSGFGIALPSSITEQFAKISYYFSHIPEANLGTTLVFASFLLALFLIKKYAPSVPGAIVLSPVGILVGYLAHTGVFSFTLLTLGDVFPTMIPKIAEGVRIFFDSSLLVPALGIALIAIIETGISATIADTMTGTAHDPKKEIFGLALGNIASGVFGGIPATAALARTSLNIKSGADHKTSGVINAVFIVAISFLLLGFFKFIPMAVTAAILVYVAYQLIEREALAHSWKNARKQFFIILVVAALCVYKDTIWGIGLGIALHGAGLGIQKIKARFF